MNGFKLSFDNEAITFVKGSCVDKHGYHLPGHELWTAIGDFGNLNAQVYNLRGFCVWHHRYTFKYPGTLHITLDQHGLIMHLQLGQGFQYCCNKIEVEGRRGQYQLMHLSHLDAHVNFRTGSYEFLTVHFELPFLKPYAYFSHALTGFLEKRGEVTLFNHGTYLPLPMEELVRAMLKFSYHDGLASRFIEGKIHELLIQLVHHLDVLEKVTEPDPLEREKAEAVKRIISDDLSRYDSVEVLARKVHTTEPKLQATFKQLYGTTVGKFSRELRLKKAFELLNDCGSRRETLLAIALSVGYNDVSNFANAFKQCFGYPPGQVHKRLKQF